MTEVDEVLSEMFNTFDNHELYTEILDDDSNDNFIKLQISFPGPDVDVTKVLTNYEKELVNWQKRYQPIIDKMWFSENSSRIPDKKIQEDTVFISCIFIVHLQGQDVIIELQDVKGVRQKFYWPKVENALREINQSIIRVYLNDRGKFIPMRKSGEQEDMQKEDNGVFPKSKRGRSKYTDREKLEALYEWDDLNHQETRIFLSEFLENKSEATGGKLHVPESTFHGWRRTLAKRIMIFIRCIK